MAPVLPAILALGLSVAATPSLQLFSPFVSPPRSTQWFPLSSSSPFTPTNPLPRPNRRGQLYCGLGGDGLFPVLSIPFHPWAFPRGGSIRGGEGWASGMASATSRTRRPVPQLSMMRDGSYQFQPPTTIHEVGLRGTGSSPSGAVGAAVAGDDTKEGEKKRILILMSDTGGGHRASALALETALEEVCPGKVECSIVDIWTEHAPWPYNKFVPGYAFLAKNPLYWKMFWEYGKFPPAKWYTEETSNIACHERFKRAIQSYNPDMIISVHPLCQDIPLRVLNSMGRGKRSVPFVTVVTDLGGAHPTWFHKDVDICFVPSDAVRLLALNCGLKNYQIRQHGLPIRSGFWKDGGKSKAAVRKDLQMTDSKTALIVGGGDGIGNIAEITESLAQKLSQSQLSKSQVVVICGKNEAVRSDLASRSWPSNVNVVVKGFVKNMDAFMGASDCIITKAGPGTIAEASTRGLPCMLFNFLPGQEEGNVPFVVKNGFGAYSKDPTVIADEVTSWLQDEAKLGGMSAKAKEASRPSATMDIAKEICDLLFGDNSQIPRRKDMEEKFSFLLRKLGEDKAAA